MALVVSVAFCFANVRHDRKKDTLEAYNRLQNEAFDKLNHLMPKDIQEIVKHPTSPEYKELIGNVARIEHFCVGVNHRIYDRKTVYAPAHGYLDGKQIHERITPIIERKNRNREDYYENIHTVPDWMKRRSGDQS